MNHLLALIQLHLEIRDYSPFENAWNWCLITDHNVRETLDIVDRAYIIHDGTLLMEGTPARWFNTAVLAGIPR